MRNGRWFEIPGNAHVEQLKRGDIIFNATQTEELKKYGRVLSGGGHGRVALADGTAYNMLNAYGSGTAYSGISAYANNSGSLQGGAATSSSTSSTKSLTQAVSNLGNTSTKSTKKVSSLSKALETLEKLFDWVEVRLDRLQSRIDLQLAKADNEIGYQDKNERISKAQDITSTLIKANKKGAKEYEAYANKVAKEVGLSKTLKRKVQNGTIDIESLDEDDQKRVEAYSQWYEKMLQCKQAVEELKTSQKELAQQKMDNIAERYDGIISHITHEADLINGSIELSEAQGYVQSTKYYESLSENKALERQKLVAERDALQKELNDAVNSGIITKPGNGSRGSEEWYTMQSQIYEVDKAIQDADISAQEFENTIRDIKWEQFDRGQEALDSITAESDFLIDLMSSKDMYDDKGKVTAEGTATYGLHGTNYKTYTQKAENYGKELESINKSLESDPYNTILLERRKELLGLQRESILAAEDEKQAIVDLVKEGIEKQLDSLQDLIDTYLDAIETQKNLYDYQNDVADQAKEIATLQKRLAAYSGDDSDEGRLKRQELQNELDEAQKKLEETEYEKYISDQQEILDELYTEYEEVLNKRLDDVDKLIQSVVNGVDANSEEIKKTLETQASNVGTSLSTSMGTIWGSNGSFTQNFNTAVGNISSFLEQLVKAADNNSGNTDPPEDPGNGAQSVRAGVKAIMAKGTAHEGAATEEEKAKHSELWTYLVDNFGYAPASGTTKELADLLGVKVSKKITDKDKDAVLTALKSKLGDTSGEGSFKKKFDDIIATGKKRDKKLTDDEKKNKSDLWKYIVKNYGREPVSGMMTNLGTLFGVKDVSNPPSKKQKDDILKAMKARGYASGTDYVKKNQWANLNEEGQEIITLPDGTILMPLAQGSGVINNPNTEKLLSLANNYDAIQKMLDSISVVNMSKQASAMDALEKQLISSQVVNNGGGEYHITNKITLELPNVNKPEDIINYLKRSDKFLDFMQTATIGRINGKSSMTRYK